MIDETNTGASDVTADTTTTTTPDTSTNDSSQTTTQPEADLSLEDKQSKLDEIVKGFNSSEEPKAEDETKTEAEADNEQDPEAETDAKVTTLEESFKQQYPEAYQALGGNAEAVNTMAAQAVDLFAKLYGAQDETSRFGVLKDFLIGTGLGDLLEAQIPDIQDRVQLKEWLSGISDVIRDDIKTEYEYNTTNEKISSIAMEMEKDVANYPTISEAWPTMVRYISSQKISDYSGGLDKAMKGRL